MDAAAAATGKGGRHRPCRMARDPAVEPRRCARILRFRHLLFVRPIYWRDLLPGPTHPLVSLMLSYAVFAVGYVARPLGGVILGHFGDRYGRRRVFIGTIVTISVTTLMMGLPAGLCQLGDRRQHRDEPAAHHPGLLPRRRAAGCDHLCRRDRAAPRGPGRDLRLLLRQHRVLFAALLSLVLHELLTPGQVRRMGAWRVGFLVGAALRFLELLHAPLSRGDPRIRQDRHEAAPVPFAELVRAHPGAIVRRHRRARRQRRLQRPAVSRCRRCCRGSWDYSPTEALVAQNVTLAHRLGRA